MATDRSRRSFAPEGTVLIEHLGAGSVFDVALVRDGQGRELVCKRSSSRTRLALGESALHRERDVLIAMKAPYLAPLVTSGSDDRGAFLLEARAPGVPARDLIHDPGPAVDAATWLALARASSHALSCLHALRDDGGDLSFVHGDVSPDNLFFAPPACATFIDLSSATFREAPDPVFAAARGTLPYVAPEVARGEMRPSADGDTYALAATLLAVALGPTLTRATTEAGRLLEVGTSGLDVKRLDERSDLPERARAAIAKAVRFDRASRLVSSRELADALGKEVG